MNRKRWLTGASLLFVLAMLAACGGGGGDGSTAVPPPDNSAPPPDNVAGFVYVANAESNNVSVFTIDATTGALTSIGAPVAAGSNPQSVTVDPSGKFVYVANAGSYDPPGTISAYTINATTGALTSIGPAVAAGSFPVSVTVDPSGKFAYVANFGFGGSISIYAIDATTGSLTSIGADVWVGWDPYCVTVDPSGKFAYVANISRVPGDPGLVSAYTINAATGALSHVAGSPFTTGYQSISVTVHPSGKFVYVANYGSNDISAYTINATTGALTSIGPAVAAGRFPISITVDPSGKFAYVANFDFGGGISVYTIDATTGSLTSIGAPVAAGSNPSSVTVDPSGKFVYVANAGSNDISAYTINATTGALTRIGTAVAAGIRPYSITTTRKIQ